MYSLDIALEQQRERDTRPARNALDRRELLVARLVGQGMDIRQAVRRVAAQKPAPEAQAPVQNSFSIAPDATANMEDFLASDTADLDELMARFDADRGADDGSCDVVFVEPQAA